jgi:hypothetical protein
MSAEVVVVPGERVWGWCVSLDTRAAIPSSISTLDGDLVWWRKEHNLMLPAIDRPCEHVSLWET